MNATYRYEEETNLNPMAYPILMRNKKGSAHRYFGLSHTPIPIGGRQSGSRGKERTDIIWRACPRRAKKEKDTDHP